jgi:RHS repeat-associated protein
VNTYTYDYANRLIEVAGSEHTTQYSYDGLGDRLQSILDEVPTDYTLDLSSGLTQVLSDGTNTYTYGLNRIAQTSSTATGYFMDDALGSVRQVSDPTAKIVLAQSYSPYGETISSSGNFVTDYGYTGELTDATGLVDLRAREYDPGIGQFTSQDTWSGDYQNPITLVKWLYANANPVMYTDPTGNDPWWCGNNMECYAQWIANYQKCHGGTSPTSTPALQYLGEYEITHYNYAMESDPQFPANDKVRVSGLDPNKTYRRQFIYSNAGIYMQGTGLAEDGTYITIDYTKNIKLYGQDFLRTTNPALLYFTYGKGGAFQEAIPWSSVAYNTKNQDLKYGDKVKIDGLSQIFTISDTGTFPEIYHLDIFIGAVTYAEALKAGRQDNVKVWKVLN